MKRNSLRNKQERLRAKTQIDQKARFSEAGISQFIGNGLKRIDRLERETFYKGQNSGYYPIDINDRAGHKASMLIIARKIANRDIERPFNHLNF